MSEKKKPLFNALDVLIVLLILLALGAFFARGYLQRFFAETGTRTVTYSFEITDVDPERIAYLHEGVLLDNGSGTSLGKVLSVSCTEATDEKRLQDGTAVSLKNGKYDLSGKAEGTGFVRDGFVYLNGKIRLVPGESLRISTGDAVYTVVITKVEASEQNG